MEPDDYPLVNFEIAYFLYAFTNILGMSDPPKFEYWDHQSHISVQTRYLMMIFAWLIWLSFIFTMAIIMLNFLIAILSTGYEEALNAYAIGKYGYMAELNLEARINWGAQMKPFDCMIFT